MSNGIVMAAQGPFQHAYGLLSAYIDTCPDDIWKEKNGGWPVWQQVVHSLSAFGFLVNGSDEAFMPMPCTPAVAQLAEQGTTPVSKADVKAYAEKCKARADAYIASVQDAELGTDHPGATARLGRSMPHVAVISMLASHTMYHLGSCDAALRDHGMPGVF